VLPHVCTLQVGGHSSFPCGHSAGFLTSSSLCSAHRMHTPSANGQVYRGSAGVLPDPPPCALHDEHGVFAMVDRESCAHACMKKLNSRFSCLPAPRQAEATDAQSFCDRLYTEEPVAGVCHSGIWAEAWWRSASSNVMRSCSSSRSWLPDHHWACVPRSGMVGHCA
jgi:hypothetical protein